MISGKGLDPGTLLHLKLVTITHESSSCQVFHSFFEEMQNVAESITQTLNVSSCYVCRGTNTEDHWPWEAKELNPQEP
jgi:hypothetical protein